MENRPNREAAAEAAAAIHDAEASRAALAGRIATPSLFFTSLGAAVAVQIAGVAAGAGLAEPWLGVAGVAVFAAVAGVQLWRFRRVNGVWLGGFASRVVLGTATGATLAEALALGAAIWAAVDARWWLVALWSVLGGAAYTLSGHRWMRTYRADPARHARGESFAWVALVTAAAVGGLALLLLNA